LQYLRQAFSSAMSALIWEDVPSFHFFSSRQSPEAIVWTVIIVAV
jgi:hypothetical protein